MYGQDRPPPSACRSLWAFMALFPVVGPKRARGLPPSHEATPLFRMYAAPSKQLVGSIWQGWFRDACKDAKITYKDFGISCFRIGGMMAMQLQGASEVEVMAQGRWVSDVWRVYSRRDKDSSAKWAGAILSRSAVARSGAPISAVASRPERAIARGSPMRARTF